MSDGARGASLAQVLRGGPLAARHLAGATFGPYEVVAELGRGAFGVVLRARRRDAPGAPEVALKVLLEAGAASVARQRRLQREAALTRALRHPGIVAVLDAGELDGLDYVAYELVDGRTLERELEGAPPARRLELVAQVAHAVAYAHAHRVIHRDLKPANVLVRAADGRALVADFGLARDLSLGSSLTKTGAVLGTPDYMAPEQLGGKDPTPAADVFALGVMLYEALVGRLPFASEGLAQRYAAVITGRFDPPSAAAPGTPPAFDALVRRALDPAPEKRFPDAGAFANALDRARGVTPVTPRGPDGETLETADELAAAGAHGGPGARGRGPLAGAALAAGVALALAAGAALAWSRRPGGPVAAAPGAAIEALVADLEGALAAADPPWPGLRPGGAPAPGPDAGDAPDAAPDPAGLARVDAAAAALARALDGPPTSRDPRATREAAVEAEPAAPPEPPPPALADRARLALAAADLARGRLDAAEVRLAAVRPGPGERPPPALALARALVLAARGREPLAAAALQAARDPAPFPPGLVEEARARALLAPSTGASPDAGPPPGDARAALAALDAALSRGRGPPAGGPRLVLRARALFALHDAAAALAALDEATRAGTALDDDLRAPAAAARLERAQRALARADALAPTAAAAAVADLRAGLDDGGLAPLGPSAAGRLGRAAQQAGTALLARLAGRGRDALAPDAEAVRAALGLLDAAPACDPRLPAVAPDFVELACALCRRDDCPPAARFQVAARFRRHRIPVHMRDDLRLDAPEADFFVLEDRLFQELVAAGDDTDKAYAAYFGFSHFARRVPALLPVCWEAEEEALRTLPAQGRGRHRVLTARFITLEGLGRVEEAHRVAAEAVALAELGADRLLCGDVYFWRSGLRMNDGRFAGALEDIERAFARAAEAGIDRPGAWWVGQRARCLSRVGRHEDALAALALSAGADQVEADFLANIAAEVRAAMGR